DRHMTLSGSARKSELSSVDSVAVADPSTVTIKMKQPFVPLTAVLADRAGMIMSSAALKASGDNFGTNPVCVGPFKFATRVAADRRVRQAFELSLDRAAINTVVFRGQFSPACGPISPASPFTSDAAQSCPKHDPAAARKLLADAGATVPVKVSMVLANTPEE